MSFRAVQLMCLALLALATVSCDTAQETSGLPTLIGAAPTAAGPLPASTVTLESGVPATWTPGPSHTASTGEGPLATVAPRPTRTPGVFPSNTPWPSPTVTPAAETGTPTGTPTPTTIPTDLPPPLSSNLLPNGSFEGGWYHIDGIPELQVPEQWQLAWEAGPNPLDEDPAPWVRPESRVLPEDFLPADEHGLYIWDGQQTVKIFKRQGAISFRLTTNVQLEPGNYYLEVHVFPDLVDEYDGEEKVWAPDPLSGEVQLIAGAGGTGWMLPQFGRKNTFTHTFRLEAAQEVQVGAAMRGRWGILNNGWFMDDWRLVRIGD